MQHLRAYSMFYVDLLYSFYDSGGHFMNTAEKIRLPDDCTIGYIIESVLGVPLTRSSLFHSHLENLQQVSKSEVHKQVRNLIQALFSSVKCSIVVLMQCFISFNLDYIELWNVWKQEEYHQHERGFLCWGGPIQVRQVPNTLDHIWILLLSIFVCMYKSNLSFFSLSGLSQCTVCCTQTLRGALLRLPIRWLAPLLYPRPSLPRYLKGMRDQCGIGPCGRCVYSAVAHGLPCLYWAAVRPAFKQFLPAWCLSFLSNSDITKGLAFWRTLSAPSFAGNQLCFMWLLLLVSHLQFS